MRLSVFMFLTDETIGPAPLAVAAEERGFSGLWVPEHPHIPVSRSTPVPAAYGGGDLPPMYQRLLDPLVALTAAALATTRLRVGTGVLLLALRDPIVTAKAIATLDHLSGGRFDCGVGFGWNADEFPDHKQEFSARHREVRERVAVMRALWRDDVASSTGGSWPLEPSWCWPKPHQRPGPPVWLGGNGPSTMRQAARWADRWFPTPSSARLDDDVARFRTMLDEEGRAAEVEIGLAATPGDQAFLEAALAMEVDEVAVTLPSASADEVLPVLDDLAGLREQLGI